MYSSTVTSRFGAEWRSEASGRSRRITCAWVSTAVTARVAPTVAVSAAIIGSGLPPGRPKGGLHPPRGEANEVSLGVHSADVGRVALRGRHDGGGATRPVLGFALRRRKETLFEVFHFGH